MLNTHQTARRRLLENGFGDFSAFYLFSLIQSRHITSISSSLPEWSRSLEMTEGKTDDYTQVGWSLLSYFPTQNLKFQRVSLSVSMRKKMKPQETYRSNTTPNTSSTSPAAPRPVIRARQSAAERRLSAAMTMSTSS
jgi:hypothetical protein